jgi:positive regulator of sigma E activity
MYNFNYEYMTFLYAVHVYMFCNVVLYCIALLARVLFAIKIIIIIYIGFFYISRRKFPKRKI